MFSIPPRQPRSAVATATCEDAHSHTVSTAATGVWKPLCCRLTLTFTLTIENLSRSITLLLYWSLYDYAAHAADILTFPPVRLTCQGPVSLTVFYCNTNSMEISFHSHLDSNTVIATKFCTCHDSCKKIVAIWWPATELWQGEVSIEFELPAKKNVSERALGQLSTFLTKDESPHADYTFNPWVVSLTPPRIEPYVGGTSILRRAGVVFRNRYSTRAIHPRTGPAGWSLNLS